MRAGVRVCLLVMAFSLLFLSAACRHIELAPFPYEQETFDHLKIDGNDLFFFYGKPFEVDYVRLEVLGVNWDVTSRTVSIEVKRHWAMSEKDIFDHFRWRAPEVIESAEILLIDGETQSRYTTIQNR